MKYKDLILNNFMIRKNKKQKSSFIEKVKEIVKEKDLEVNIEKGAFGVRNIVIGDVSKAKVVFTAHYDTCAVMPVPNFITPTNIWIYLLYQVLIMIPMFGVPAIITWLFNLLFPGMEEIGLLLFDVLLFGMLFLLMFGPANKNTVNDNTSGVLTILNIISKLPLELKDKVAFVLFDLEEVGLIGSGEFASKHKKEMKDKLVINYDCVSDGEKMLFIFSKKAKEYLNLLSENYISSNDVETQMVTKGAFYPSDQANFKYGVGVCAVIKGKKFEYIDKIHTKKDTVLREENIKYLTDNSIKLVEKI